MHYIVFKVRIVFVYNNCHKMFNWLLWNVSPYASTFFFAEDSVSKNTIRFIPVLIYDYANFCWKDCRYISIFALPLKGKSKFFRNFYASREIWLDLGAKYLLFFSPRSLITREKCISFAQFVYFWRKCVYISIFEW